MTRALLTLACILLGACSGKEAAPASAAGSTQSSAPASPAADASGGQCIEEFVQVFEQSTDNSAPASSENLCFDDVSADGPPKFPGMSRKVTLEYKNGDYLAIEESAHWTFGEFDVKRSCTPAVLSRTKITARKQGEVKDSTRLEDGKLSRSHETGEDYGSSIPFGSRPTGALAGATQESTPFGVDCTRVAPAAGPGVSMCSVVQPRTCASTRIMLPIEIRTPSPTGGTQTGKTTALRTGAVVDSKSWVLP